MRFAAPAPSVLLREIPVFAVLAILTQASCVASPTTTVAPAAPVATEAPEPTETPEEPAPAPIPDAPAAIVANPPALEPVIPSADLGKFVHELDVPVISLAIGDPKIAVLGVEPYLYSVGKWRKIPFPAKFKAPEGKPYEGRIFFGRDDRVRIMGRQDRNGQAAQLYLRHRNDIWIEEKREIAKLLEPAVNPLWGVLGHADPEVVCKKDDVCIVKRKSGWKTIPAGPGTPRVDLFEGIPYAMHPDSVAKLEKDKTWVTQGAPAPFKNATGMAAIAKELWVGEESENKLHHFVNGTWVTEPSPVAGPRGMWAPSRDDVWLAGVGGLAHFDGTSWSKVLGPEGPLVEVQGRKAEVWAIGQTGVWARHRKPSAK